MKKFIVAVVASALALPVFATGTTTTTTVTPEEQTTTVSTPDAETTTTTKIKNQQRMEDPSLDQEDHSNEFKPQLEEEEER